MIIPDVFTEQDRQDAILRAIMDNDLFINGVPPLLCKLDPNSISAALRLHDNLELPWGAFQEGFHFKVTLTLDQFNILKASMKAGSYVYATPLNAPSVVMVDAISRVPFEVVFE